MNFNRYQYKTFYAFARFIEGITWVFVIIGIILALTGFSTGGILGNFLGRGEIPFLLRLIAALPGLGIAYLALFFITVLQHHRAGVDAANMAAQALYIARRQNPEIAEEYDKLVRRMEEDSSPFDTNNKDDLSEKIGADLEDGDVIITYKGKNIIKDGNYVKINGNNQIYNTVEIAKGAIDRGDV